jgi:hypothetical protein
MSLKKTRFVKGIILAPDSIALDGLEGEFKVDSASGKVQTTLKDGANPSAAREILTNSQTQTVTNKTIDVDNNTVSNIEVDNLKSGVLNTSSTLTSASDLQVPSALATKTYSDSVGSTAASNLSSHASTSSGVHGVTGTIVGTSDSQALTNKTIDADLNTISNIENADIKVGAAIDAAKIADGSVSNTEFQYLSAVTSDIQTQFTNKVSASGGTLTNGSIITPVRLDAKQDTLVNLQTYALTATNGQIVYATDEKQMFQVVDTELVAIGGADVIKLTAGENLALRDLVYISTGTGNDSGRTAGQLYKADASNDDRAEVVGFVSKAANVGGLAEIQLSGILKGFSGLTAGRMYYASSSSPGAITLTPPSANGSWVIAVGIALSATQIDINPVPSASAIYVVDGDTTFTIANNQATTDVTGLLFDGISTRGFIIDYSIYRQTDTASSALAQVGQLRGVYNTQSGAWFMSDDYSGQNAGVTFSILSSGQLRYSSTNIAGTNYVGTLKYAIRKTFGV